MRVARQFVRNTAISKEMAQRRAELESEGYVVRICIAFLLFFWIQSWQCIACSLAYSAIVIMTTSM